MNPLEIQNRLGENLKTIRKSKKLTQFQLAEKSNVSEDTIKSIELSRFWPSERTLSQITQALDIDIYHLFLPTTSTIKGNPQIEDEIKQVITQKYCGYINSVMNRLTSL